MFDRVLAGGSIATLLMAAGGAAAAEAAAESSTELSGVEVVARGGPAKGVGLSVLPSSVQDTPQVINVVSKEQLREQNVSTLEQALRNVPGITIAIGEGGTLSGDQFKIRGFDAKDDNYVDGLRDFGVYTRDSFDIEEVQVLKGPSGVLFGRGAVGGAINTVSKVPSLENTTTVIGGVGDGAYYRAVADVNRVLGPTTAVRLNLMGDSNDVVGRDLVFSHRWGVALAGGLGLGTDLSLTVNYMHEEDRRRPDYGIVIVQPPGGLVALPASEYPVGVGRQTFTGYAADADRTRADIFTARLIYKPTSWLTVTSDGRLGFHHRYFQYTTIDQCLAACTAALFDNDPATAPNGGAGGSGPYDQYAWGAQNITAARAEFNVGRMKNQLITGFDVSYQYNDRAFQAYTLPAGISARNLIPHDLTSPPHALPAGYLPFHPSLLPLGNTAGIAGTTVTTGTFVVENEGDSTDLALFATDRLWLTDAWSVIAGVRVDDYDAAFATLDVRGVRVPVKSSSTLTNPRASLVYEPTPQQTYYLSYGKAATPQGASIVGSATAIALTAKDLEPEVSETLELGAKFGLAGGRLGVTGSVFRISKDNATQTDPATGFVMAQSGERQAVKGLELGLTGRITRRWSVTANYTYLDSRIKDSFSNCALAASPLPAGAPTGIVCAVGVAAAMPVRNTVAVGRQAAFVPRNAASVWSTLDFGSRAPGLSVSGGVTYQSRLYLAYTPASRSYADRATLVPLRIAEAPASLSFDGAVAYRFGRYRVALNGYNLTNRLNYSQVFSNRAVPAAGRTAVLSLAAELP